MADAQIVKQPEESSRPDCQTTASENNTDMKSVGAETLRDISLHSDEMSDSTVGEDKPQSKITTNINRLRNHLMHMIDTDYGLIDELHSKSVLSLQLIEEYRIKAISSAKVKQLLDDVTKMSDENQELFLAALENTQQPHIAKFIRQNGTRETEDVDDWPLIGCDEQWNKVDTNWRALVETIDTRNGLLDELLSVGCINSRHREEVDVLNTNAIRNEQLLIIIGKRTLADYNNLIKSLVKTKQHQVVSLLTDDAPERLHPLTPEEQSKLCKCYPALISLIDSKNGLLTTMLAADCITWRQKEFIEAVPTQSEMNSRLLEILKRGSKSDLNKFIECLRETGQQHICSVLLGDAVIATMVARLNEIENTKQDETRIVEQFMNLLHGCSDERKKHLRDKVDRLVDALLHKDTQLTVLDTQGSIRLFFTCNSLAGMNYLYDLYSTNYSQLIDVIAKLFTLLLNEGRYVNLNSLEWSMSDFNECVRHMYGSSQLPVIADIYLHAQRYVSGVHESVNSSLCIDGFPHELVEIILIKAVGQLFVSINKVTQRAQVYALASLCTVSRYWWRTLSYRPYNEQRIKRYIRHVCRPHNSCPQELTRVKGDREVWGVAELNEKLYVSLGSSNKINVFTSRPPFSRLEDINVEGLDKPNDIIACSETSQLYISDQQYAVWRMNLLSSKEVVKFIATQWQPWSLSIKSRRLIVTPYDGDALFIYGDDGVKMNRIPLPDYMDASIAAESSRNTYIVSHTKRYIADTQTEHQDGVTEVDADGRIIRQFNNQLDASLQFNRPRYLLIDASNHVIVADSHNERIVLLKPDLQLKRVLIPKLQGQPRSMCFNEETGLLFVSRLYSTEIRIYSIMQRHSISD